MKILQYFLVLILLISINSCQTIQTENLIGSWKTRDLIDTTGKNIENKATFTKDGLFITEFLSCGKTIEKEIFTYNLKNNIITIKSKNQYSFYFKILKLNDSEMELLNIKENKVLRYIR